VGARPRLTGPAHPASDRRRPPWTTCTTSNETPTSDAARSVGHYLTGALAAADLAVRVRTLLAHRHHQDQPGAGEAGLRPGDLERAGRVLDPKREAHNAMLGRDHRRADSRTALLAWAGAQPQRDSNPQAELVAGRAEARLRDLHPDAMVRYDSLRAGLSPVEAMPEVVPLIDPAHTAGGRPTADSAALAQQEPELRYAPVGREALQAELADQVLRDQAWPALARSLARAEQLGSQPAELLRAAAGERELASAKSVTEVLTFRIEQRQPEPQRTAATADLAAASYPIPLAAAGARGDAPRLQDLPALGKALELSREADIERQTARASADTPTMSPPPT